jgi:glycerol kinase
LTRATSVADIVRATLEGIACRVYEVAQAMQQDAGRGLAALKVDGGASGNPYLMQCLADLLGAPVQVAAAREATAMGVALLAGHSIWGTSFDELSANWRAEAVYTPRIDSAERERRLARWRRAVQAVRTFDMSP